MNGARDIRLSTGILQNPKIKKLLRRSAVASFLCLLKLWIYTALNRPTGRLDGMSEEDIEIVAEWTDAAGEFVAMLTELRFLDRGDDGVFVLHNWAERQPWVVNFPKRSAQAKEAVGKRWKPKDEGITPAASAAPEAAKPKLAARRIGKSSVKRTWPADLALDGAMRTFAAERGVDPELEFEAWRADCAAHDRKYADWPAAWRTRILNAPRFGGGAQNGRAVHRNGAAMPPTLDELLAREKERPA